MIYLPKTNYHIATHTEKPHRPSTGKPSSVAPFDASGGFTFEFRVDSWHACAKCRFPYDASVGARSRTAATPVSSSRNPNFKTRKFMKTSASIALIATVLTFTTSVSAQFAKPDDAIRYRKSSLFVMQQNFGRVAAMASGKAPFDAKVAADSAAVADYMAKLPWAAFGEGTDKGDTRAKAEIWKESAKFKEYAEKMQGEMSKLAAATKAGNLDSIKTAVNATGGACKTCHDAYRKD